jgi:hypothetical protein
MRTTFDLNDELFRQAKKRAADDKVSLKSLVESALRSYLAGTPAARKPYVFQWTPDSGGLAPGIDLGDWTTFKNRLRDEDLDQTLRKLGISRRRSRK